MDVTYNFTAGTRAVAQQVNTNFADVKSAVDVLETDVADLQAEVSGFSFIKADGSVDFTRLQSYATYVVSNATNATPIVITAVAHSFLTGDKVYINGVGGNTAANGTFTITKIGADTFSLDGSVGNGAYTSGGIAITTPVSDADVTNKIYTDNAISTATQIDNIPIYTCSTATSESVTGTVTVVEGSTTVTGSGTLFTTELITNGSIYISNQWYNIYSISSNTSLSLTRVYAGDGDTTAGETFSGLSILRSIRKRILVGDSLKTIKAGQKIVLYNVNKNMSNIPLLEIQDSLGNIILAAKSIIDKNGTITSMVFPAYFPAGSRVELTYTGDSWRYENYAYAEGTNGDGIYYRTSFISGKIRQSIFIRPGGASSYTWTYPLPYTSIPIIIGCTSFFDNLDASGGAYAEAVGTISNTSVRISHPSGYVGFWLTVEGY